jgi:hypothetical protein
MGWSTTPRRSRCTVAHSSRRRSRPPVSCSAA